MKLGGGDRIPTGEQRDLMPDAADISADDGRTLPHCFGDGEAKTFAGRLLQDDSGMTLQRIHEGWIVDCKDNDAFVGHAPDAVEYLLALRIIAGVVANE